jgi:NADPH:quinone reductase-like Zn-dependent oxidoreductase
MSDAGAATMTAIVHDDYGTTPEEVLRVDTVPRPAPGDSEVLVRVHAASVDRGTWHAMAGLPLPIRLAGFGVRRPKQLNPGRALAGTVERAGPGLAGFSDGDEVYGIAEGAAFAEYAVVPVGKLATKPAGLDFEAAATVPISAPTALQAVHDQAKVQPGESVLVIGASGGVGSFAVQLAKGAGADVTGVCTTAKVDMVRSLGADHVIDHTREGITDDGRRYDVILDIGGNRRLAELRRALAPHGRLVLVGAETGGRWLGGLDRGLRAMLLSPFVGQRLGMFIAKETAGDLNTLRGLTEAGELRPVVDRSFPLEEVPAAIDHLVDGRAAGKVAITVRG